MTGQDKEKTDKHQGFGGQGPSRRDLLQVLVTQDAACPCLNHETAS